MQTTIPAPHGFASGFQSFTPMRGRSTPRGTDILTTRERGVLHIVAYLQANTGRTVSVGEAAARLGRERIEVMDDLHTLGRHLLVVIEIGNHDVHVRLTGVGQAMLARGHEGRLLRM